MIGAGLPREGVRRNPPLIGCRCMARGRRGCGPAGREVAGTRGGPGRWLSARPGAVPASTAPGRSLGCRLGVAAVAPAGHAEPCWVCCDAGGAPAGSPVLIGSVVSPADIPENAPGRRECRRWAAGYGAESDSAVTAAPGAPGYRVRAQRSRGRRWAARGAGRSGAPRSRAQLPSGLPDRPRSRAQLPSGLPGRPRSRAQRHPGYRPAAQPGSAPSGLPAGAGGEVRRAQPRPPLPSASLCRLMPRKTGASRARRGPRTG